jgi:ferredoxin
MFLPKEKLNEALAALTADFAVFLPMGEGDRKAFRQWEGGDSAESANLDGNTVSPPKDLLFPRSETLYSASLKTGEARRPDAGPETAGKTALFGARPCDARGIGNLDAAFLEKGYVDRDYAERRENLTIIALACATVPSPACFCDSVGGSPAAAPEADVLLTEAKDATGWLADFQTEKGAEIRRLWSGVAADANAKNLPKKAAAPSCALRADKPDGLAAKLSAAFEDEHWERLAEACIGCGCCTYVCPTCYCFDIDQQKKGADAETFRCWDSCMFPGYTQMAGGHNPRWTKTQRLRNRYLHKLAYFDERYGKTLCVGCGRCVEKCPAGVDITKIIEWGGTL